MNRNATILSGLVSLLAGASLVIVANRQGWIGPSTQADSIAPLTTQTPVVKLTPFAVKPRASETDAKVVLASSVTEIASLPRTQRPPSAECANATKAVVFADDSVAAITGIRWEPAQHSKVTHVIGCNVEIDFNGERLAHVSARAPGVLQQILKQAGDHVQAGETLALLDSSELGGAKAALLQANALAHLWSENLARLKTLAEGGRGAVTQQELMEAETNLTEARIELSRSKQHLRNLGVTPGVVDSVIAENDSTSTLAVVAPFDGLIVERHAARGEVIDIEKPLFMIADTSTMWAVLDVRESDIRNVQVGQRVQVTLPALRGEVFGGTIEWMSASVDDTTRTLKVRASLDNAASSGRPAGALRANMFGKAQIIDVDAKAHLVIPRDAVQWDGCCNLVFVRQTDRVFQPFKVTLGADLGDHYVVLDGLREGDEVVTSGAFLLRTQVLKSSIGAGCCEVSGGKKE